MNRMTIFICMTIMFCQCSDASCFKDIMGVDYSDCTDTSISLRTSDSYDGMIDGVYYIVRIDRRTGKIEKDYRIYPPMDSTMFLRLSIEEQREDEINRHIPLDKSELNRIYSLMKILRCIDAESVAVDKNCNVHLSFKRKDCEYAIIRVQPGYSLDDVKERFYCQEDYVLYKDNWYVHKECKECKGRRAHINCCINIT